MTTLKVEVNERERRAVREVLRAELRRSEQAGTSDSPFYRATSEALAMFWGSMARGKTGAEYVLKSDMDEYARGALLLMLKTSRERSERDETADTQASMDVARVEDEIRGYLACVQEAIRISREE